MTELRYYIAYDERIIDDPEQDMVYEMIGKTTKVRATVIAREHSPCALYSYIVEPDGVNLRDERLEEHIV